MFSFKKKDVEDALSVAVPDKSSMSRRAARQYCDKLYEAIALLKEFNEKKVDSFDELNEMKTEFWKGGNAVTLARTPNGLSVLIDSEGEVIASHMILTETEVSDE